QHFTFRLAGSALFKPVTQYGIDCLDAAFILFTLRAEFVQQATGTQFWKSIYRKYVAAGGFQRIAELAKQRGVVTKEPGNSRRPGFLLQQVEHVLMIRHKKVTRYAGDLPEWRIFKIKMTLIHNDLPSLYMN